MVKTLRFTQKWNEKVFFFSDPHVGHCRSFILKPRGYGEFETGDEAELVKSVNIHDKDLIENWNKKVGNNDTVFLLGDTAVGPNSGLNFAKFLEQVNFGTLFLMPGNHFAGYKQAFQSAFQNREHPDEFYRLFWKQPNTTKCVFLIPNYYEIIVDGQFIVLSHYPLASWNHAGDGSWMICGHSHGNYAASRPEADCGKILDVGPECCGPNPAPRSFEEVKTIMNNKVIHAPDHHLN